MDDNTTVFKFWVLVTTFLSLHLRKMCSRNCIFRKFKLPESPLVWTRPWKANRHTITSAKFLNIVIWAGCSVDNFSFFYFLITHAFVSLKISALINTVPILVLHIRTGSVFMTSPPTLSYQLLVCIPRIKLPSYIW